MRALTFSGRTGREMIREPLNIVFGLGFPLVVLLLMSTIQAHIPVSLFELDNLVPGITVFGLSFMTLFSATLVAKDRESAFLQRLYTTPLRARDFIVGYILPLLPIALLQSVVCYAVALILGLSLSVNILWAILLNVPAAFFFLSLGLLCGSVMGVKQVGGLCGALLTNLTAWLSGVWFDISLMGKFFMTVADYLPFVHSVELARAALRGDWAGLFPHLYWVLGYALVTFFLAILLFLRQMKRQ